VPVLVLFAFGLALRLLFQAATPDGGAGWHVGFQGDAPVWQELAHKLANGVADDSVRLPLRPPAMQWLVSLLWNGDPATAGLARTAFAVFGASIAPLVWLLLRQNVTPRTAALTAVLCAASSNLLLLSSGLHVEGLYLTLVLASLLLQPHLAGRRAHRCAFAFGVLNGLLCLLRAEHVLTTLLLLVLARRSGATWRTLALAGATAAAVVAPWQLRANAMIDDYNAGAPALPPAVVPWDDDAVAAVRALPSFQQVPVFAFVGDTVRTRGGTRVRAADLAIVREAYDCWPEPLPRRFVALYGGLNFYLGNTPEAAGGFSAAALDRAPPLAGGEARYPPGLRQVLPRNGTIAFGYPPHLDLVVNGTRRGLAEVAADPFAAAGRVAKKLWHAAEGATGGLGGHALPIGLTGTRRQVDFVTATGWWANGWRLALLALAAVGLWRLRTVHALRPLLVFAATKLLVVAAFYGYARHGALCLPVVALGVASATDALLGERLACTWPRWLAAVAASLLALEVVRAATTTVLVDGKPADSWPANDFRERLVTFR
jgi:hypothetical protein